MRRANAERQRDAKPMHDYYLIIRTDAPGSAEKRQAAMAAHLKYSEDHEDRFLIGGATRPGPDAPADGSTMIITASSLEDAQVFADLDPFSSAGVYADTQIKLFRAGIGKWIGGKVW